MWDLSKVLEIYYVGLSVRTSEVCRLRQKLAWVQWTLWRDKVLNQFEVFLPHYFLSQVIALQTNGEILVFSLLCPTGQLMYKSEPYTVVMYKVGRVMTKPNLNGLAHAEPMLDFPGCGVLLQSGDQVYLLHSSSSSAPV